MKKKKIDLGRKLFLRKDLVSGLNAIQSHKVVGGWATNVKQSAVDPNPQPGCMSCPATVQDGCPTHVYSRCQTYQVNGQCCVLVSNNPPC